MCQPTEDMQTLQCDACCADLVFIQNGMLQPWLAERGLQDNTQVNQDTNTLLLKLADARIFCIHMQNCPIRLGCDL